MAISSDFRGKIWGRTIVDPLADVCLQSIVSVTCELGRAVWDAHDNED